MSARPIVIKERTARRRTAKETIAVMANLDEPVSGRWSCHHRLDGSDIEAYIMTTGSLEVIAQTRDVDGTNAHANAERIVRAVNAYQSTQPVIAELIAALEMCLASDALSTTTRQAAELAIGRAGKKV